MLKNEYFNFRTQAHEMIVEGSSDTKPTFEEVAAFAKVRGYQISELDIAYDDVFKDFRFCANLKPISK